MAPFRFLDLAAELRNEIYVLSLVDHNCTFQVKIQYRRKPRVDEPALLSVCRQIRREAEAIFWSENTFQVETFPAAAQFLNGISDKKRKHLKTLRLGGRLHPVLPNYLPPPEASGATFDMLARGLAEFHDCLNIDVSRKVLCFAVYVYGEKDAVWVSLDDVGGFESANAPPGGKSWRRVIFRKQAAIEEVGGKERD